MPNGSKIERDRLLGSLEQELKKIDIPEHLTQNPINKLDSVIADLIKETVSGAINEGLIKESQRAEHAAFLTERAVAMGLKKEDFDEHAYDTMTKLQNELDDYNNLKIAA